MFARAIGKPWLALRIWRVYMCVCVCVCVCVYLDKNRRKPRAGLARDLLLIRAAKCRHRDGLTRRR